MKRNHFTKLALIIITLCFSLPSFAEPVWIDVRSSLEYKIDHIEGDIRISHGDIVDRVSSLYPDKETEIHLYCRSGGRAGKAMTALQQAGYSKVTNIGSIGEARKQRNLKD